MIAIETSEHMLMPDLHAFFAEAARVPRPGCRLVVCALFARDQLRPWKRHPLLDPICREGRLLGMEKATEYHRLAHSVGLVPTDFQELSRRVGRTWSFCTRRVVAGLFRKPEYRRFLFRSGNPNRIFMLIPMRIWLAYSVGAMRYGTIVAINTGEAPSRGRPG